MTVPKFGIFEPSRNAAPKESFFRSAAGLTGLLQRWMTATMLLVLMIFGGDQSYEKCGAMAFAPQLLVVHGKTAVRPVSSSDDQGSLPLRQPSRLFVASAESSTSEASAAEIDLESLRGEDGIYHIETKEQHK